jgi:cytochrome P450
VNPLPTAYCILPTDVMHFPPGPRSLLPGAHLRAMQYRPLPFLTELARDHGDASHFRIGRTHFFFFSHPDLVREVLIARNASFIKGLALQRTKIVLGEGLLTSEGELHKRQRRLAQPAFHRQRIQHYGEEMVAKALVLRDHRGAASIAAICCRCFSSPPTSKATAAACRNAVIPRLRF